MSDNALKIAHLGKSYRIGRAGEQTRYNYRTLREDLLALPRRFFGRRGKNHDSRQTIWALRDVSFEVEEGEVIGIIGRNGAGKSTLLKILSRVTEPTKGFVDVNGRVGSLLEVGTGFHPELTGRENIYLNGAILGMTKAEITGKFDEIVDFAEIEQFLETPVKHYSSGMYMRLAFGVAAHLQPEILLVDEVLAVGDAEFQAKCLGKMSSVAKSGRTVLFVSHNMAAIQQLCSRCILLANGCVAQIGPTDHVVKQYAGTTIHDQQHRLSDRTDRGGNGAIRFRGIQLLLSDGTETRFLYNGKPFSVIMVYDGNSREQLTSVRVDVAFFDHNAMKIVQFGNEFTSGLFPTVAPDNQGFRMNVDDLPIVAGRYYMNVACYVNGFLSDWVQQALFFDVIDGNYFGSGKGPAKGEGCLLLAHRFSLHDPLKTNT